VLRGQQLPAGRWTEHDRTTAVALTIYESALCSGCGQPLEESTSPAADPASPDSIWHYDVPAPARCHGCTAMQQAQTGYQDADSPHALRWHAVRVDHDE
jgi:hypothetical protein